MHLHSPKTVSDAAFCLTRIAATPPGYSSGFVLIFREPQAEHFMCLLTSGTGVSGGSGTLAGWTFCSRPHAQQ